MIAMDDGGKVDICAPPIVACQPRYLHQLLRFGGIMSIIELRSEVRQSGEPGQLDRTKWHLPLVSIVVTHFNYSAHLKDALLSICDQTHENWECVVVDDCSEPEHRFAVEAIIKDIGSDKIRLLALPENVGQIPAFFAGLDATSGNFVCLLDPR